jgi:hypothetical protein
LISSLAERSEENQWLLRLAVEVVFVLPHFNAFRLRQALGNRRPVDVCRQSD